MSSVSDESSVRTQRTYRRLARIVMPVLRLCTARQYSGMENIPATGGFVAVSNHVTNFDPLTFLHFVIDAGRLPRIMAKASLFRVPVLGWALRVSGQIRVERVKDPGAAIAPAVRTAREGHCVALFPEGTLTQDPHLWPMKAKTGAVRIALEAGVPVIPVAQWGAQDFLRHNGRWLHFLPRATVRVVAGPAIDLSDLPRPTSSGVTSAEAAALREGTDRVMRTLTDMVATLRDETPPAAPYDPRATS